MPTVGHTLLLAALETWQQVKYVAPIYLIGLALESLRPAQIRQPLANVAFNLRYTPVFLLLTNLIQPHMQALIRPWIDTLGHGWLKISLPAGLHHEVLQAVLLIFVLDFFYYWAHRLQHFSKILWAQHRIHHSEQSLNITSNNRHHWLEEVLRSFLILLPFGVIFDFSPIANAWIWGATGLYGYFIHMNLKLDLGIFTPLLVGPQAHRIHHSCHAQHLNKNFAAFFPVFDIAFGTYYRRRRASSHPLACATVVLIASSTQISRHLSLGGYAFAAPFSLGPRRARGRRPERNRLLSGLRVSRCLGQTSLSG